MPDMSGHVRAEFDAATTVTLRDIDDGAETGADVDAELGVPLDRLDHAFWDNGEIADGLLKVNIYVSAIVNANSNAYVWSLEACTAADGTGAVEVARLSAVPADGAGYYESYVSSDMIKKLLPAATHLRIKCTKTTSGGSPSITYGAWLTFHGVV